MNRIAVPPGQVVTIELPGLTAVRIDTRNRLVAIDGISGETGADEYSWPRKWQVKDLRDGTYGDFHRLTPAGQCMDRDCIESGQHVTAISDVEDHWYGCRRCREADPCEEGIQLAQDAKTHGDQREWGWACRILRSAAAGRPA